MRKQFLYLWLVITPMLSGMQQESGSKSSDTKCPGVRRAVLKRRAQTNLTKAIRYYVLKHKDVEVDSERKVAQAIESYFAAQHALETGDEKEYERKLLESAQLPYRRSLKELSQLYLKRAQECYQKAADLGDEQADTIATGLKRYLFKYLIIGKKKECTVTPMGLYL